MSNDERAVKVFFSLERVDDWPPVTVESVWARATGEPHHYLIENTPFFVHEATLGDVVIARHRPATNKDEAKVLWFCERVAWGGNALIRLIMRRQEATEEIVSWLKQVGCICEGLDSFAMVAVTIPREVDQVKVQKYLLQREETEDVHVEEAILR